MEEEHTELLFLGHLLAGPSCKAEKAHNERASEEKKKRQKSRTSGACLVLGLVAELVALGCAEKRKGAGG